MLEVELLAARILIVDDQPVNVIMLERLLEREGFVNRRGLTDLGQVLAAYREFQPDLILLDLMMPPPDGFSLMRQLRAIIPVDSYLPILVLTADITPEAKLRALAGGAKDFLTKPFDMVEVLLRIRNLLETRFLHLQLQNQNQILEEKVRERTAELRQTNEALRQSEERYRLAAQATRDAIWDWDWPKGEVRWSEGLHNTFRYPPNEVLTTTEWRLERIHPEDRQKVMASLESVFSYKGEFWSKEYRFGRADGAYADVFDRGYVIYDDQGQPGRLVGAMIDMTDRKRAEAAAAYEQSLLQALLDNSPDYIYFKDTASRFTRISRSQAAALGMARLSDALGKSELDFRAPAAAQESYAEEQNMLRTLEPIVDRLESVESADGRLRWFSVTKAPIIDTRQQMVGLFGISRDITERQQRERELSAIATVSSALRDTLNRDDSLRIILDNVLNLLNGESAGFSICDPVTGDVVNVLTMGKLSDWTGARTTTDVGIVGRVITTGQPYFTNKVQADPYAFRADLFEANDAVAGAPLIARGAVGGALWVARRNGITDSELRVLMAIADIAASALENARLFDESQRQLNHLQALRQIDDSVNTSLDLTLTLDILLEQVKTNLKVDAACLLLYHSDRHRLQFAAGRGFRGLAIQSTILTLGEGVTGRAALNRGTAHLADLTASGDDFGRPHLLAEEEFVAYFAAPIVTKGNLRGLLEIFQRSPLQVNAEWEGFAETFAGRAAIAIENLSLLDDLRQSNVELSSAYDTTLEGWSRALDLRDKETEGHSRRVTEMTIQLGRAFGLNGSELANLRRGALLHDIGKMGIPDNILLKPSSLTEEEWVIMRKHPEYAYQLLRPVTFLHPALDIPYCHHERWDGSGYPRQLAGEDIPLAARIFALADVWDALRSDRPYRPGWSKEKAIDYVSSQSGKHFDPRVAEVFMKLVDNFENDVYVTNRM